MKPSHRNPRLSTNSLALAVAATLIAASHIQAATGTWNSTSGTWDATGTNWTGVTGTPWDGANGPTNIANFTATSGSATVSGTVFANQINNTAASGNFTINGGTITLSGTSPSISVNATPTLSITSTLAGTAGLTKFGSGNLTLSGPNSFTGTLGISAGTVSVSSIGNSGVVSAAGAGSTINLGNSNTANTALIYNGTGDTSNKTINLNGRTSTLSLYANNASGLLKFTSNLTATTLASRTFAIRGTGAGEIAGSIVDAASGSTALTLTANSATNQLDLGSTIGVAIGAAVSGTGIAPGTTIQSISGNIVTLSNNTTAQINSGSNVTIAGVVNRTALTKADAGTWTLSGANTYTGLTTVSAGKLTIASGGTINSTSGVSIGAGEFNYNSSTALSQGVSFSGTGGILSGNGTISSDVAITSGNTLAPGADSNTLGTLNFGSTLTGSSGATFSFNIDSSTGLSDQINVAQGVSLAGSTLSLTDLGSATLNAGQTFVLVTGSSISGTFLNQLEGSTINVGNNIYSLSYSGNQVSLSAIPEPSAYAALAGALALGVVASRRRRRPE